MAFKGTSLVNKSIGTEEQPHISKAYDEGFICHSALAEHERIHTWENLYKCAEYTMCLAVICHCISMKELVLQKCKECGKAIRCFSYINYPQRLHTGEKLHIKIMCQIL